MIIYTRPQYPWMWYPYLILSITDSISKDVYEKALQSVKINMNCKEFESIMQLIESENADDGD